MLWGASARPTAIAGPRGESSQGTRVVLTTEGGLLTSSVPELFPV